MAKNSVASTQATSTESGARSTSQVISAIEGKESTALDSTVTTSTSSPRSVEDVLDDMKTEDEAKGSDVVSRVKSQAYKWKKFGVNAKKAESKLVNGIESLSDAADDVKDTTSVLSSADTVLSGVETVAAVDAVANKTSESEMVKRDAPTDTAIAGYQASVKQAQNDGLHVKGLLYTDAQQKQWNAQDQHRMYSNYGQMYIHGNNEADYNMALMKSALAIAGVPQTKTLSAVPTLKQKFLAEVVKDDNQMDINSMSLENILAGNVDLLKTEQKQATESLSDINAARNADVTDKFEAIDHNLDGREAEKNAVNDAYSKAMSEDASGFTDTISKRLAMLNSDGLMDRIKDNEAQMTPALETSFF